MKGIGVDIVDLERLDLHHIHFIQKILTRKEYEIFQNIKTEDRKKEYLGGRFAAKEAYMKACHKGIGQLSFQDIEVLNHEDGSPYFNDENALLSISHEKKYAIAFVILKK